MSEIGGLKKCVLEYFGGMTGGNYRAVVRKKPSGAVVEISNQEWHHSKTVKVKKEISLEEFSELEKALSGYDFEKRASDELIAERSEIIALDAPTEVMKVTYDNAVFDLSGDDLAPENTPARRVIIEFFDNIYFAVINSK